ncbi:MAG: hypothetical protein OXE46_14680 [Chloroflexi bacterium]|nr:hypothetical protein [Chloroflexota bacterium]
MTHIEAILPYLATKADIERLQSSLIKWIIGTWLAMMTIFVAVLAPLIIYIISRLPA